MPPTAKPWRDDIRAVRPMLATLGDHRRDDPAFLYEPKYDGIRALVDVQPGARGAIGIWSRLGNEKTAQFPEIVAAFEGVARGLRAPLVVDGEIVALDEQNRPAGFQQLQGRIHVTSGAPGTGPVAFLAFDLLREGGHDLRDLPLTERRTRLERVLSGAVSRVLRVSDQVRGDGEALWQRALEQGWEGLIAKRAESVYRSGRRSPDWLKLKLVAEQEFVIGGWTEPRGTRAHFGALLLGVYDGDALEYVGHTGAGFDGRELQRVFSRLKPLETPQSPFRVRPRPNERPHWVRPELVAQVKFTEWTSDAKLRHPTYLGLRDDVSPRSVRREAVGTRREAGPSQRGTRNAPLDRARGGLSGVEGPEPGVRKAARGTRGHGSGAGRGTTKGAGVGAGRDTAARKRRARTRRGSATLTLAPELQAIVDRLEALEAEGRDGSIVLPDGDQLAVTNLRKVFWPAAGFTKGDLFRHYVRVAPCILPVVDDRPLVMKRHPNGIAGQAFYQQRAPDPVPRGVRVETVEGDTDVPSRLVGGNLKTLLYMAQIASISMDPWFSTMDDLDHADQVAIDLDPQPGATFAQILDVARWVHEILERVKVRGYPKTSGSEGLHIFIPLPPGTPYEAGMLFCQIVATTVAARHPKVATVERMVGRRKDGTVYVDYLQNIQGKTLACAYSARGSAFAGVSAPLTWKEVHQRPAPQDFTIDTIEKRVKKVGDLWSKMRNHKGTDLLAAIEKLSR